MDKNILLIALLAVPAVFFIIILIRILSLRRIVPTNVVHIVQQGKETISYGVGKTGGNVYYEWPKWLPKYGVEVRSLPVSNFDVDLKAYEAYDKDRLPFEVDVKAFFRISDTNKAAEKVESFGELKEQLTNVVKGSVRSILAKENLNHIMEDRATFGIKFTEAVNKDLENWGVEAIKSIELMDIKDAKGSEVIHQIMQKKMSAIDAESRTEIANNKKKATEAELESAKEIALKQASTTQESEEAKAKSEQAIGIAKAESEKAVGVAKATTLKETGIAEQKSKADVAEATQKTAEKEMTIVKTRQIRQAEIDKESAEILAEQNKRTSEIGAEAAARVTETNAKAKKMQVETEAEAALVAKTKEADGIKAKGLAEAEVIAAQGKSTADAKQALELASVTAQTTLAEKIGQDEKYQAYLLEVKRIEVSQVVGLKQAEATGQALSQAELKLLVNSGDVHSGLQKFSDIFSTKGAFQVNSIVETLSQTKEGKEMLEKAKGFLGIDNK